MKLASQDQQSLVFHALSDLTRREILSRITQHDMSVAELSEPFSLSPAAISKHLKTLEKADLIERVKDGKQRRFKLNTTPLHEAKATIERLANFWTARLNNLESFLEQDGDESTNKTN